MKSKKIKIVADDKIPFLKGVFEPFCDIEYYPGRDIDNSIVKSADALITRTRTKCNSELLHDSKIKLITTATIGYDHIDINYCENNGIKWINAPGCNSTSVMQYISNVLLFFAQKESFSLQNKTLGIVGAGNVGRKIEKISEVFGIKTLLNDPPRERKEGSGKFCSLSDIQNECDIITFHVPLNKEGKDKTLHLLDDTFLSNLKKRPVIINSSRGEVIHTLFLKNAIKNRLVANVALDVWENEPEIDFELLNLVDIATPHIAGYSADGKANGTSVCVNEINKFFNLNISQNWYPEDIPIADNGDQIYLDCKNLDEQQALLKVIAETYDVLVDDQNLRENPDSFEKLREDYRIRREFESYKISLRNCTTDLTEKLMKINFNIN